MRHGLTWGAAVVAAAAALSVAVNGLVTPPDRPGGGLFGPSPAAAEELEAFGSCEELRDWYVEAALPHVGPYGFGFPHVYYAMERGSVVPQAVPGVPAAPSAAGAAEDAVGSSGTGTNVQEVGVDEPDRAKTDGSIVVHVDGGELRITDVTGRTPQQLGSLDLPERLYGAELLLVGATVLVVGTDSFRYGWGGDAVLGDRVAPYPSGGDTGTRLLSVDISDPEAPTVTADQRVAGSLVSARQYRDVVRAVISTGYPALDFVHPNRARTERAATAENRRIVRESSIDDWLPTVSLGDGAATPLLECENVRHPEQQSGFGTISVVTFHAATPTQRKATAVTAGGELVYSSPDRLYVATTRYGWDEPVPLGIDRKREPEQPTTEVHAFALDELDTSYVASGEVQGIVRDRWSFSEHAGYLRVATQLGDWARIDNAINVLQESGGALVQVGRVRGLGAEDDETIQSIRWFDELAVVVTFRQTDPLYTVDLSDPANPRVLGELKIPGFSSYLHPIGDNLLLGMGQNADRRGISLGGQAALFDVSDLRGPERLDVVSFGPHTGVLAGQDPRTFTYLPDLGVALTLVQDEWRGGGDLVALEVGPDGSVTKRASWVVGRWDGYLARALPLGGGKVALVDEDVRLLDVG